MTHGFLNGVVLSNGSQVCRRKHTVATIADGSISFTDVENRRVKQLLRGGSVVVIAGTGDERNRNGSGSHTAFGQRMETVYSLPMLKLALSNY